jgi:hypothetical protein
VGRFELFGYFLALWPLCSLLIFILYKLLKNNYPNFLYIVLQSIFTVALIFSVYYQFTRG